MTQKPEIVGFYLHCYPALIPERGVSAAGFSDQIRIGVFTKLVSSSQSALAYSVVFENKLLE